MFTGNEPAPPVPDLKDASAFLVSHLKRPKQQDRPTFGYDTFLPIVVEDFCPRGISADLAYFDP